MPPTPIFASKKVAIHLKLCYNSDIIEAISPKTATRKPRTMNTEDLILQKLESMDTELKNVRSEIRDVRSEIRDVRSEMNDRMDKMDTKLKDVDAEIREIRDDALEMKINQAKHAGDLHTLDAKVDGKFQTLNTKIDGLIENARERRVDTNERWKIGGIIVSCGVAVVSIILSILTRMGQ